MARGSTKLFKNLKPEFVLIVALSVLLSVLVFVYYRQNTEGFSGDKKFEFYYADWCPHCKRAKPHVRKLMKEYSNVEMIDCVENPDQCKAADVNGYPTIKIGGKDYDGPRTLDGFKEALGL